jgi:hypothetical protein
VVDLSLMYRESPDVEGRERSCCLEVVAANQSLMCLELSEGS